MPYPLPVDNDTWKPDGAVAVMFPVKLEPETVNCWMLGLVDADPAQAEIEPVTVPAVITGDVDVGTTVMVKVTGGPLQTVPPVINLPYAVGFPATGKVFVTALVAVLITDTSLE